jgi:Myb-like DNA-binding domain
MQEDEMIIDLVGKHGAQKWAFIASQLPGRIGKQCRERLVARFMHADWLVAGGPSCSGCPPAGQRMLLRTACSAVWFARRVAVTLQNAPASTGGTTT